MRYTDYDKRFSNVRWQGVDPDIIGFRNKLAEMFPQMKVTSASRNWGAGRHQRGQAMDIAADPEIHKFFYSKQGEALLKEFNLGFLDETLEHNMKKTGATGPHFHIGKDSTLVGKRYEGNTAFAYEDDYDHSHEGETHDNSDPINPNNVNNAYDQNQIGQNAEFLKKIYEEKRDREAQLSEQLEEEKASIARQNAIQERIKSKMENQIKMAEMIQGLELENTTRTRSFEEGGEFAGLEDNLKYKIEALKQQMPNFKPLRIEESETYKELTRVRQEMESLYSALAQVPTSTPVEDNQVQAPDTTKETPVENTTETLEPTDRVGKISNQLKALGLEKHQIAGVLGSLSVESYVHLDPLAHNKTSNAFGIAQWLGSRLNGLKEYGKSKGRDFKNEDIQIEFLAHELENEYKFVLPQMKKAKTIEEATVIWTRQFERPSEKEIQKSINERLKNAKMFYTKI